MAVPIRKTQTKHFQRLEIQSIKTYRILRKEKWEQGAKQVGQQNIVDECLFVWWQLAPSFTYTVQFDLIMLGGKTLSLGKEKASV